MGELVHALTDRRYTEKTIAYAESHDQVRQCILAPSIPACSIQFGQLMRG